MNVTHPLFGARIMVHESVAKSADNPKDGHDRTWEALEVSRELGKKAKDTAPDSFSIVYTGAVDFKPQRADYEKWQPFGEIPVGDGNHGDASHQTEEDYAYLMVARQVERDTRNGEMYFRRRVGEDLNAFFSRILDNAATEYQKMRESFGLS